MKNVLIAGGSGLIGSRLTELLIHRNYSVSHLSRKKNSKDDVSVFKWTPRTGFIEPESIKNADYIINLAGENIGEKKWTLERKKEIIRSRIDAANTLKTALIKNEHYVECIVCASAIGYYKKNDDDLLRETDLPGNDFLSTTTQQWESASRQFEELGIRTVILRTGIVLSLKGGALLEMYKPLRFGLAGYFGNGKQYYSWIHIDDLCQMYIKAMEDSDMKGVFNAVSPHPETSKNFIKTFAECKGGFYMLIPVPSFALKVALGEKASVVLDGQKISSKKITDKGFVFQFPQLNEALKNILKSFNRV